MRTCENSYVVKLGDQKSLEILKSSYGLLSQCSTLRTKKMPDPHLECEFHPYWDSLSMDSLAEGTIKIHIKTFETDTGEFDGHWHFWFDLFVDNECVIAVCQLYPNVKVTLLNQRSLTQIATFV